jgi:SAM-dependent methyltransferase
MIPGGSSLDAPRTRKKQQAMQNDDQSDAGTAGNADTPTENARLVRRAKGVNQQEVVKTHGLPAPDGSLNKGRIFEAILSPLAPGKLLDLGAGKGNFSMSAASMGWEVTAVDVRTVRWPEVDPQSAPEIAALLESITFVQSDIREFPIGRNEYDLICILGLLHHLEVPDQVALIRKCTGTPLLIDTRIASAEIDSFDDYRGMLIKEHGETREERDQVATASWGNETSFRHSEESLTRLLRDCGYPIVFQARPPHRREYTFYFALPRAQETAYRREKRTVGAGRGGDLWKHYTSDDAAPASPPPAEQD